MVAQIAQVTKERDELQTKNTSLTLQAKQLNDSNARLADLVKGQNEADSTAVDDGLKATQRLNDILSLLEKLGAAVAVKLTDYKSDKDFVNAVIAQIIKLEGNPQASPQDHLQAIVKFLTDIGINNWLQKHKFGGIDLANAFSDPQLSQKVNAYLTELIKELEMLDKAQKSNKPVQEVPALAVNPSVGQVAGVKKPSFFSRLGQYLKSQVLTGN